MKSAITILAFATAFFRLQAQQSSPDTSEKNRRLFTTETFGGNGRTCLTCHTFETGTVSPQDAQERYEKNPHDPLFVFDGSDDGKGHGVSRMLKDATILMEIPLPPNVALADDPKAKSVTLRRGIPTTRNTPALDPVLMLDGRESNLQTQALHAIQAHFQPTILLSQSDLLGISQFELTDQFFSSPTLRAYARAAPLRCCRRAPRIPRNAAASSSLTRHSYLEGRAALARSAIAVRCSIRPTPSSSLPPAD